MLVGSSGRWSVVTEEKTESDSQDRGESVLNSGVRRCNGRVFTLAESKVLWKKRD